MTKAYNNKAELIAQGAEAKIFLDGNKIIKERVIKGYRHPIIDAKIRKSRTKHEGKILFKAKEAKINVPQIFNINKKGEPLSKSNLEIEYIPGDRLSESMNKYTKTKQKMVMEKLGEQVALLHKINIIHGDLTTSNTILLNNDIFIIDFGLGFISLRTEDKAVDLHLIKQALEAKHFENWNELFDAFRKGYKWEKSLDIFKRLEIVESRGRYK